MAWSDELGKLPKNYKMCLAFIAILIPFWYIFVYLFAKPVYYEGNNYLLGSLCFCLAVTWFMVMTFITGLIQVLQNQFSKSRRNLIHIDQLLIAGGLGSIVSLAAVIYLFNSDTKVKEALRFSQILYISITGLLKMCWPLLLGIIAIRAIYFVYTDKTNKSIEDLNNEDALKEPGEETTQKNINP